jgi:hypothetical protein
MPEGVVAARARHGILTSGPAAVASHQGRDIAVVVRGTDNACWHTVVRGSAPA